MSLLPLLASFGCDSALTVRTFAGTVGQFTLDGISASTVPTSQHLELWARTQYNDIARIDAYTNLNTGTTAFGFIIRQAISLDDPCMIDSYLPQPPPNRSKSDATGHLLIDASAFSDATIGGVLQTADEQAKQVRDRIKQLTTSGIGGPLLAVLPYTATQPPAIPATATPEERKAACDAYVADRNAYVPNPYQITTPLNGTVYGFVKFISTTPAANYDGFRLDSPVNLKGVQEIFFTVENDQVDPHNRGPLFLTSTLTPGGRDIVHFDLTHADPNGTASGTAALEVDLDEDPVQF